MEGWAPAVIAGTLLAYSALQSWRPGVVPPAIAFTAAGQWRWLLTPTTAAFAFGLATPLGGSGFIAAFVAGIVFGGAGGTRREVAQPLPAEDLGALLTHSRSWCSARRSFGRSSSGRPGRWPCTRC